MGAKGRLTPREVMEREKARLLEQATAIDRDMAELDRIAAKYNLAVSAPGNKPALEKFASSRVTVEEPHKPQKNERQGAKGSVARLVARYRADERSPYLNLRYKTRKHYDTLIKRILEDCGNQKLADLKARDIERFYKGWTEGGKTAMGKALVTMFRSLVYFGATVLEDGECERLSVALHRMRFAVVKTRNERLNAEQAMAICRTANEMGRASIALAQAFQFDCKLRQKDIIGEWVPVGEPEDSDVIDADNNNKWLRGIRWEEIDENLILTHIMSRSQKEIEVDLKLAPMVMAELGNVPRDQLPAKGPVIISEASGLPWYAVEFRRNWRLAADKAGVPRTVKNMDTRAGAISEATNAKAIADSDEPKLRLVK
jgi:hypothetical protein